MNLFRTILGILRTDADNRRHHGVNHYPEHSIGSPKIQFCKLAGLMIKVNAGFQTQMDEYILSRMETHTDVSR